MTAIPCRACATRDPRDRLDHGHLRPTHKTIRMVARSSSEGYRRASDREVSDMLERGTIRLEGVDGDETENTVTYWYARREVE